MIWRYETIFKQRIRNFLNRFFNDAPESERRIHSWKKRWYTASALTLLVVLGILPPISLYRTVHDEVMELFTKQQQLAFADRLRIRVEKKLERYSQIRLTPSYQKRIGAEFFPDNSLDNAWDVHAAGTWRKAFELQSNHRSDSLKHFQPDSASGSLISHFRDFVPGFTSFSHELHNLTEPVTADTLWEWIRPEASIVFREDDTLKVDNASLVLIKRDYRPDFDLGKDVEPDTLKYVDLLLSSPVLYFRLTDPWKWFLAGILILTVLGILIKLAVYRLFLTEMLHPRFLDGKVLPLPSKCPHRLVLRGERQFASHRGEDEDIHHINASRQFIGSFSLSKVVRHAT
ncbi:MAG: hypothetical protein GWN00_18385, partial [Aliifodinibius sp.]|nr:hypothetical protein [Fodinibius sp.]NIV13036.1 hypothetical protein [Fodinibius sp.]NIY26701.1 hypothetical protein [Fodinibius sp.]